MDMTTAKRSCPNEDCELHGKGGRNNIRTHGWYKTKLGRRRRYRCAVCEKTFSSTAGSSYHKLKASRQQIDQACHMSAEGVNISVIARIKNRDRLPVEKVKISEGSAGFNLRAEGRKRSNGQFCRNFERLLPYPLRFAHRLKSVPPKCNFFNTPTGTIYTN